MIGILNAYHFDPTPGNFQESYTRLFIEFIEKIFPERKDQIKEYKVAQGIFPKSVAECEIWFITGSPKSVYEDIPWILDLVSVTREIYAKKIKLVGICFGHQLIAHALGGQVSKSAKGWGVGIRSFNVIEKLPWMTPLETKLSLLFSHQDQVDSLPPSATKLATDDFCPNQMMQIGTSVLSFQGHPEFTIPYATERLKSRIDLMPIETYQTAMDSFANKNDDMTMVHWLREFLK